MSGRRRRHRIDERITAFSARRDYDVLLVTALAALAGIFLIQVPHAFGVDSWLGLVAGREVWQAGVPHHDTLTVISHGATWIDQQWLSQLATYAEYELGGLGIVALVNVMLIVAGVAGAAAAARRLGAGPRAVIFLLPVCAWLVLPSGEVRTQEFALPLFVATCYLLAADSRRPSARVYWCLPLLVLWANLHGSVALGVGLVMLRGLTLAWERRAELQRRPAAWWRPVALTLGAPLCLAATPYGLSIVSYYRATLLNSALKHAVTEWQPVTSSLAIAIPFFVLAGGALWSFGRHRGRLTLWDQAAVILLAIAGIDAVRNVSFFALGALMLVAVSLDPLVAELRSPAAPLRPRINAALAFGALTLAGVSALVTAGRPARIFEQPRLVRVLNAVKMVTAEDPSLHVFADQRSADWLLWRDPQLRGRIAFDVRFELLSSATIRRLQLLNLASGPTWKTAARGYRLIVLDAKDNPLSAEAFLGEVGRRVLYDDGNTIIVLRTAAAAAQS